MPIVKSARGVDVDFDLLKIKGQLENIVPPQEVRVRENFIDKRMTRKQRLDATKALQNTVLDPTPTVISPIITKGPSLQEIVDNLEKDDIVEEPVENKKRTVKTTKE